MYLIRGIPKQRVAVCENVPHYREKKLYIIAAVCGPEGLYWEDGLL